MQASNNAEVWRWDSDPFGANGQTTAFMYNLRFLGQYYDQETGLYQNWMREYDPNSGRYIQADPVGLEGGMSRYGYVGGNPLNATDLMGLATYVCQRPLKNFPWKIGPFYHQYVCVGNKLVGFSCGGLGPSGGDIRNTPGVIEVDAYDVNRCQWVDSKSCVDNCVHDQLKNGAVPNYSVNLSNGDNCQTYTGATIGYCQAICSSSQ